MLLEITKCHIWWVSLRLAWVEDGGIDSDSTEIEDDSGLGGGMEDCNDIVVAWDVVCCRH